MREPGNDEFVYQTRRSGPAMDPAVRRIVLGAGGASALVILVALVWSGVHGVRFGPPPVILPPPVPLRVVPADPGGLVVPEANVPVMSGDAAPTPVLLAPAPPVPAVQQLDQAAGLAPPAAGASAVQLAAADNQAGLQALWQGLQAKMPQLLAGKTAEMAPALVNGQRLWRLRLGGFANPAAAQAFCTQLLAKGTACTVAPL